MDWIEHASDQPALNLPSTGNFSGCLLRVLLACSVALSRTRNTPSMPDQHSAGPSVRPRGRSAGPQKLAAAPPAAPGPAAASLRSRPPAAAPAPAPTPTPTPKPDALPPGVVRFERYFFWRSMAVIPSQSGPCSPSSNPRHPPLTPLETSSTSAPHRQRKNDAHRLSHVPCWLRPQAVLPFAGIYRSGHI